MQPRGTRAPDRPPSAAASGSLGTYAAVVIAALLVLLVLLIVLADNALRRGPDIPDVLRPTPIPTAPATPTVDRASTVLSPEPVIIQLTPPVVDITRPPTPTVVPVRTAQAPRYFIYTVQPGDSIGAIAQRFGYTFERIANLNGIDEPYVIQIGEELLIPNR